MVLALRLTSALRRTAGSLAALRVNILGAAAHAQPLGGES